MKNTARLCILLWTSCVFSAPPPQIPGEDMTEFYNQIMVPADSIAARTPSTAPGSENWLDRAMSTWDAPPLAQQMAENPTKIPMGLGAIYVPYMTESALEPECEIIDSLGELIARGKPGTAFAALPGTYWVMVGSGSHQQAMVRPIVVEESRVSPLIPDWAGLTIEVVSEDNIPFRGEFELARIDRFEPYGRGFGPDPDLGEKPDTRLLPPGIYKIFSVGDGYNTLRNFITVHLLPGRLTRVLLIVQENELRVVGGGIVDIGRDRQLASNWKYGLDMGGGALFNAVKDRLKETEATSNSTLITLLLNGWLRYEQDPREWYTSLRLDEGFSFSFARGVIFDNLLKSEDNVRLRSLFIWRLLPWVGPYGRFEVLTKLFPTSELRDELTEKYFAILNPGQIDPQIDSARSYQTDPAFSPFDLESGVGANIDIINRRYIESRLRSGFGYGFSSVRNKSRTIEKKDISRLRINQMSDTTLLEDAALLEYIGNGRIHEAGPEAALLVDIRLGRFALSKTEVKVFAPIAPEVRINRPDLFLETSLSWRLARAITLDYRYNYSLKQPQDVDLHEDLSVHRVQLRYSFTSR